MRQIRFHPSAAIDAEEAAIWYAAVRPALGTDFLLELEAALALLRQKPIPSTPHPRLPSRLGVRRIVLKRFTYDLVYVEREAAILVVAIAHHSRRPDFWKARLST